MTEFVVLPHKDSKDVFILGGTDEIQQLLDDSNINIATIASSRHVGPIKPRVDEWQRQLDLFGKTLVSRRFWVFLERYSGSATSENLSLLDLNLCPALA